MAKWESLEAQKLIESLLADNPTVKALVLAAEMKVSGLRSQMREAEEKKALALKAINMHNSDLQTANEKVRYLKFYINELIGEDNE